MLNSWVFNVVLFIILQISFLQMFKLATRSSSNNSAFTVLIQMLSACIIIVFIPFFGWSLPNDFRVWLLLISALIFYAAKDRLDTTTRKNLNISVDSMLGQLFKVLLIIYGIVFFKEKFVLLKVLGGFMIVASNMLIFFEKGKFKFNKFVLIKLAATFCMSVAFSLDVGISGQFNLPFYIFISYFVPAIFLVIFHRISFTKLKAEFCGGNKAAILIASASNGLGAFFIIRAYQLGSVVTIASVSSLYVLLNVVFAYFFLKERGNLTNKLIAAAGIITGLVLIAIA